MAKHESLVRTFFEQASITLGFSKTEKPVNRIFLEHAVLTALVVGGRIILQKMQMLQER